MVYQSARRVYRDWSVIRDRISYGWNQPSRSRFQGLGRRIQADHSARRGGLVARAVHAMGWKRTCAMTRPLRRNHLWIWICLSILLSVLFTAALLFGSLQHRGIR